MSGLPSFLNRERAVSANADEAAKQSRRLKLLLGVGGGAVAALAAAYLVLGQQNTGELTVGQDVPRVSAAPVATVTPGADVAATPNSRGTPTSTRNPFVALVAASKPPTAPAASAPAARVAPGPVTSTPVPTAGTTSFPTPGSTPTAAGHRLTLIAIASDEKSITVVWDGEVKFMTPGQDIDGVVTFQGITREGGYTFAVFTRDSDGLEQALLPGLAVVV